jgi:hypothetical protein
MALEAKIENGYLILRLPLEEPIPWKKKQVVASSHGKLTTTLLYEGRHLMLRVKATIDPEEIEWQARARASMQKTEGRLA